MSRVDGDPAAHAISCWIRRPHQKLSGRWNRWYRTCEVEARTHLIFWQTGLSNNFVPANVHAKAGRVRPYAPDGTPCKPVTLARRRVLALFRFDALANISGNFKYLWRSPYLVARELPQGHNERCELVRFRFVAL